MGPKDFKHLHPQSRWEEARWQDKVPGFEGRKVPKKVITESSISQALSISKLCHQPTDSRPQNDTQKNLSLPQGAALGCFVLGAPNHMLWAWGVRASLPFYSSQGLKVTLYSLQRFSLSQFCGHLVKLGLIKIQPQISSPWGFSEHSCFQKATCFLKSCYIPHVCHYETTLCFPSIFPKYQSCLPKEVASSLEAASCFISPEPYIIWTYNQAGTKEKLSASFIELELWILFITELLLWICLFSGFLNENKCQYYSFTFFSSADMNYQSLGLRYLVLADSEFTTYFGERFWRKLTSLLHFPILCIGICPWGTVKQEERKRLRLQHSYTGSWKQTHHQENLLSVRNGPALAKLSIIAWELLLESVSANAAMNSEHNSWGPWSVRFPAVENWETHLRTATQAI